MRKLRLSASSITDYLECPKRFWYRTNQRDKAVLSDHVVFGSIVHEAIEQFENPQEAVKWSLNQWDERMTPKFEFAEINGVPKPPKSFTKMLGNYYTKIFPELPEEEPQATEHFFEIPWSKDVIIIGKIDKIAGLNVYDWKTGARPPTKYVLQSFQFYLYEWAYNQMYGRFPHVFYGHLNSGEIIPIEMKDDLRQDFIIKVDNVINEINNAIYYRVPGYQCGNCFYRDHCFNEMDVGIGLEY